MSAFGSSVINKSNTKIKPKAAPSRRAPASSQTSARTSVDRQVPSRTPQPQSLQNAAASSATPADPILNSTPGVTDTPSSATRPVAQNGNSLSRNAEIDIAEDSAQVFQSAPQKRPGDLGAVSIPLPSALASHNIRNTSVPVRISPSRSTTPSSQTQEVSQAANQSDITQVSDPLSEPAQTDEPANKRRRLEGRLGQPLPAEGTDVSFDEALPTTEPSIADRGTPHNQSATPPPSQVFSQPIRRSTEPVQPANQARKPRKPAKAKGKQRATERLVADDAADVAPRSGPEKGARRRAKNATPKETGTIDQNIEDQEGETTGDDGTRKRRKRKKREVTPENAEDIQIDPAEVRMSELTKNIRTGKKSTRGTELQAMDEEAKAKRKQKRIDRRNGVEEQPDAGETPAETAEERLARLAPPKPAENVRDAPTYSIVDGQMVLDEASLVIDRTARGAAERGAVEFESVEENDLTRRTNQASWGKRDKSGGWDEMLTGQFYEGLRMFGTDFNMISKMFPGRSRHSVKLKFNKEEQEDPVRIERVMKGERLPVNMDEFQKASNTIYGDPEELEREMEEDRKKIEEEAAAQKAALDEVAKLRADEAAAEAEAADRNDSSAKENRDGQAGEEGTRRSQKKTKRPGRKKGTKSKEPSDRQRNLAHTKAAKEKTTDMKIAKARNPLRGTLLDDRR